MATYLDPKIDILFKKIFGENKELLISFLNSLLPLQKGQEIVSIEYLSPEQVPSNALGKNSIVDVNCKDNSGRSFIVEMQSEWSNVFRKRLLVNGSKAVVRQMDRNYLKERAKPYKELKPVYFLAILNGKFSEGKDWYHHLKIMDFKNPDVVIDGLDYVLVELPNFTPETWCLAHKKLAVLWLRFLKEIRGYYEKLPEEFVSNELIYNAIKICERSSFSPKELFSYDHAEMQAMWDNSIKGLEDDAVENKKILDEKEKTLDEKDKTIVEKEKTIEEKEKTIEEREKTIEEREKTIEESRKTIEEKEKEIEELKKQLGK
jgi:predicted transposase/invertase (TIGR01784 family)